MIGCFAEAASREVKVDETELAEAIWLERSDAKKLIAGERVEGIWVLGDRDRASPDQGVCGRLMADVALRPYREADRADVARVWFDASLSSIPGEPMPPDLHKTLFERIPNELAAGWTLIVATENEKVVGMLAYFVEGAASRSAVHRSR